MSLANLIRKRETGGIATAIPAISATQHKEEAVTVARIATVAVANPQQWQTAPRSPVGAGDTPLITSHGWMIHFADREPVECYFSPTVNYIELMKSRLDAIGAEPLPDLPEIQEPEEVELC